MSMDTFNYLVERLRGMTEREAQEFSERAGVPWGTLLKIKYGQTKNPSILTVEKIQRQLRAETAAA